MPCSIDAMPPSTAFLMPCVAWACAITVLPAARASYTIAAISSGENPVAPGSILVPGGSWHRRQQAEPEAIAQFVARELPFGRFGRSDEVGAVVAFLASTRASWISGACLPVDGCQSKSNI